jgi:hypothetical protein
MFDHFGLESQIQIFQILLNGVWRHRRASSSLDGRCGIAPDRALLDSRILAEQTQASDNTSHFAGILQPRAAAAVTAADTGSLV